MSEMATAPLTTIVSTKGQIILPKSIRVQKHWSRGTRLVVEETADGVLLRTAAAFPPTNPQDVFASLAHTGKPKSLEDMEAGILAEAARRDDRD
jgi:AbrB family looped-hinge helix DNA binding protein